jgi:signal transduction histidine kinase/CheY-like chemotaxis protein
MRDDVAQTLRVGLQPQVLVADDDGLVPSLLADVALRLGPNTLMRGDGANAVRFAAQREFKLAVLDDRLPQAVHSRYQLVGSDQNRGVVAGERQVALSTNLDRGRDTIRMTAANGDGVWSAETRSVQITVIPHWWQAGWFLLAMTMVAGARDASAVRPRPRGLPTQQRRLEAEGAARTAALVASNTSLIAANARLERQVQLERELITTLELDAPLGRLLEEIRPVVPFTTAMIFTLDGDTLVLHASHGCSLQQAPHPIRLELRHVPALAQATQSFMLQVFADPGEDDAMMAYLGKMFGQQLRGQTWLVVPLLVYGKVIGLLVLAHSAPDLDSEAAVRKIEAFINPLAFALENVRLHQRAQEATMLEERNRLARELHDTVTQTLFAATLIAEALPDALRCAPERAAQGVMELRHLTGEALAEMRTLLLELRPKALTEQPLGQLLRLLCTSTASRSAIPIHLTVARDGMLDAPVQLAYYRVAQEALNNVVKHAEAQQVVLTFDFAVGEATLCVSDDGKGFAPDRVRPGALGLGIMHERAAEIGATLLIDSELGAGTTLTLHWQGYSRDTSNSGEETTTGRQREGLMSAMPRGEDEWLATVNSWD